MAELLLWLTMTVYFEARGETDDRCQVAVARVVLNRMKDGDVKKVILAPSQFSWVGDKLINGVIKPEHRPNVESAAWKRAERSARTALYSTETFLATHFHAVTVNPKWNLALSHYQTCGNHHFYL
jgi:spore germination cell wall hydrolase CwlJ-like protein